MLKRIGRPDRFAAGFHGTPLLHKGKVMTPVKTCLLLTIFLGAISARAAEEADLYDPSANVEKDVAALIQKSQQGKKHIFLQIGGNWCGWCIRFHKFVTDDDELKRLVGENFEVYHLNYSEENKNAEYLKKLRFPQRFGFPVFVILDADGKMLHTQDSALLEEGDSYNKQKVTTFLENWSAGALDEAKYKQE
jgi:thioredoxin-related protein